MAKFYMDRIKSQNKDEDKNYSGFEKSQGYKQNTEKEEEIMEYESQTTKYFIYKTSTQALLSYLPCKQLRSLCPMLQSSSVSDVLSSLVTRSHHYSCLRRIDLIGTQPAGTVVTVGIGL
ncbi:hypothetical protein CVT25_012990 [Psilocybe cyanescens]|uniref:Uncharacterized protein n=1 Tax=Psilocybe cyanescens TaxID=93625 RepID=A0A409XHL4_PSICY|nr:hypothetical protein CVT25_012990 [Psilocybe cyanescens]